MTDTAAAEISTVTEDGRTVVYTDSPGERLGFVDITNPARPRPAGTVAVGGEPTSVAHLGDLLLAAVDPSASFADPSGKLVVLDARSRAVERTLDLGGQPDSVAGREGITVSGSDVWVAGQRPLKGRPPRGSAATPVARGRGSRTRWTRRRSAGPGCPNWSPSTTTRSR